MLKLASETSLDGMARVGVDWGLDGTEWVRGPQPLEAIGTLDAMVVGSRV